MAAIETGSLADKINKLYESVHPAGRGPYTDTEVARTIRATGGPTISASYLWQLRHGERTNPTMRHLEALATFFGVPASYFFGGDDVQIGQELELLAALRDAGVRHLALRAADLPADSLAGVTAIIDQIRTLHGLPGREVETDAAAARVSTGSRPRDRLGPPAEDHVPPGKQ